MRCLHTVLLVVVCELYLNKVLLKVLLGLMLKNPKAHFCRGQPRKAHFEGNRGKT